MTELQVLIHLLESTRFLDWNGSHGIRCVCTDCQRYWIGWEHSLKQQYSHYLLETVRHSRT